MPSSKARLVRNARNLHRWLMPIALMPLFITTTTGMGFQAAVNSDRADDFLWLLSLHIGNFGIINLEAAYPFLNGLGLLTLLATGLMMWLGTPSRRSSVRSD